jgi:hypothetical protein
MLLHKPLKSQAHGLGTIANHPTIHKFVNRCNEFVVKPGH